MGSFNTLTFSYYVCDAKATEAVPWQRQQRVGLTRITTNITAQSQQLLLLLLFSH